MQAAVIREHGGPDKLLWEEVPDPVIGAEEVLIRVEACALNRMDIFLREGLRGPGVPIVTLPHVSGGDVAGVVEDVGAGVTHVQPGDPVVVYPGLFCGRCEACLQGEQSLCESYRIFGEHIWGGLADLTKVPARNVVRMPEGFSFAKTAALPAAYTTAWRMLVTAADLRPGQTVLVVGASGGVGCAALQIGVAWGARVLAVVGSSDKIAKALDLGAEAAVNHQETNFQEWVMEQTNGRGVDVVADPVGAPTWRKSINSLVKGGAMVICGATAGDVPDISIREVYQRHRRILGAPLGSFGDFLDVLKMAWSGRLDPVVHAVYPLGQVGEAQTALEQRTHFGKVVVRRQPVG